MKRLVCNDHVQTQKNIYQVKLRFKVVAFHFATGLRKHFCYLRRLVHLSLSTAEFTTNL